MNYIGSKYKLADFILDTVKEITNDSLHGSTFCDLFAGTGIVGRTFKPYVSKVISNDIEFYSYVLNRNYIGNNNGAESEQLINELNNMPPENGLIFSNYCLGSGSKRQYFSDHNGMKIDAIRKKINLLLKNKKINEDRYYFLLASLLESADSVANTASVYAAFLKHLKKTALKELQLMPASYYKSSNSHEVYNQDANELIKKIKGDILYLDPPYNQRQYGNYYHILNTIAKYEPISPKGKTGMTTYFRSNYCSKRTVSKAFNELICNSDFKYIVLSYNNEGLMTEDDIASIMKKHGQYTMKKKAYQRFKADKTENRIHHANQTYEYLHILEK